MGVDLFLAFQACLEDPNDPNEALNQDLSRYTLMVVVFHMPITPLPAAGPGISLETVKWVLYYCSYITILFQNLPVEMDGIVTTIRDIRGLGLNHPLWLCCGQCYWTPKPLNISPKHCERWQGPSHHGGQKV